MQRSLISRFLQDLHESDQRDRRALIATQGTSRMADAKDLGAFFTFKGTTEERARIVYFFVTHHALTEKDDYRYAACVLVNAGRLDYFVTAYQLIKRYRELGGDQPWKFHDSYFDRQNWGKTRDEVEAIVEREIGCHPRTLDRDDDTLATGSE